MGKIAFIFPGQGSQQIGMGQQIAMAYQEAQDVFQEADEALDMDLSQLCFQGPKEVLQFTANTQPALLTTSIACLRVFEKNGIIPDFVAGHSLGEYSALVAACAISFQDAVKVVHKRGLFMEEAVPSGEGAMAAVLQMDRDMVRDVCITVSGARGVVEPANYNCPGQIVISGHTQAVRDAGKVALERGARKVIELPVSGPFHSSLMMRVAEKLEAVLETIQLKDATIPVISNVSACAISKQQDIFKSLVSQVYHPVLWEDSIRYLEAQGVDTFIEIGSGEVLTRLTKKIVRHAHVISVQDPVSCDRALQKLGEINGVRE